MDLETENRIAAILLKEAAELRRQAEKEGVRAYLEKPNVRFRPNSRFLTATVLGVQQANKAVEVSEMWKLRNKELELDDKIKRRSREESSSCSSERRVGSSNERLTSRIGETIRNSSSVIRSASDDKRNSGKEDEEGLRDEEIEEFLQSRTKRGRGSVGSRMDETGPYLPACPDVSTSRSTNATTRVDKVVLGPERPRSLRPSDSSSSDQEEFSEHVRKKPKKDHKDRPKKKHRSKDKYRDDRKKGRKEEKKRKRS